MSVRRLTLTVVAMGLIGVLLECLTPAPSAMAAALAHAQRTADSQGADVLVTSAAGLVAWAVWAWGTGGLVLTAFSALPGAAGGAARLLLHLVLPAGARHGAAVLLGLGLAVAAPVVGTTAVLFPTVASAAVPGSVPDWPVEAPAPGPVPDWPARTNPVNPVASPASPGAHVVLRGNCLWDIAAAWLRGPAGPEPTDGEVAVAAHAWWTANESVIGADPDLLLPGQVLVPPETP